MKITQVPHWEYDNLESLNTILSNVCYLGFDNGSWGNDVCPSLVLEGDNDNETYRAIWFDYKDPSARELDFAAEFCVADYVEGECTHSVNFDTVNEVIEYVTK